VKVSGSGLRGGHIGGADGFEFRSDLIDGQPIGEGTFDLSEEFASHFRAGGIVEPVEEPPTGGGFAESLVGFEADASEKLLDLADGFESLSLPAAEPEGTGSFDGPILNAHERGWGGGAPLGEPRVVGPEGVPEGLQSGS
jgi:hypothetical protein